MNRRPVFSLIPATLSAALLSTALLSAALLSGCATAPKPETEALASDILDGRSNQLVCGPNEVRYCAGSGSRIDSLKKAKECGCIAGPAIRAR